MKSEVSPDTSICKSHRNAFEHQTDITTISISVNYVDFAACCTGRTFTATIMCRTQQKAMNTCMMRYATQAEQDAARAEWFATIDERRIQREQKEAKRVEDEKFWREWWDKESTKKPGQQQKSPMPATSATGPK
jgi:COX assembly protein 1